MKIGDITSMGYQAETATKAAEMLDVLAEGKGADASAVLRDKAEALRGEAATWEEAARLKRSLTVLRDLGGDLPETGVGTETAAVALAEAEEETETRIRELLAPYLKRNGTPKRFTI